MKKCWLLFYSALAFTSVVSCTLISDLEDAIKDCNLEKVESLLITEKLTGDEKESLLALSKLIINKKRDAIQLNKFERINPQTNPELEMYKRITATGFLGAWLGLAALVKDDYLPNFIQHPDSRLQVRTGIAVAVWAGTVNICQMLWLKAKAIANEINVLNEQHEKALKIKVLLRHS